MVERMFGMSRVLLTGATGHVGKAVTRQLVMAGIPLLAVGRRQDALERLKEEVNSSLLATAAVELTQPESIKVVAAEFGPFRKLIHLAAQVDANASLEEHMSGNLLATISLVACLRDELEQIVNMSSIEVYGMPNACPIGEDHVTCPETYYGAGKLASEKFLQVFGLEKGATVTNLRCSSIYGPGETILRATTVFLKNAVVGQPIRIAGDGSDLRDYIFVEDVAMAVLKSMKEKKSGVFNLGGGEPITISDMAQTIIDISGKNLIVEYVERTKPKYDLALDNSKIFSQIGFKPQTGMTEGLAAEYQCFLEGATTRW